jgi:hypothetical protein
VLTRWLRYDVVVLDEVGYVPLADIAAELLFRDRRTRRASHVDPWRDTSGCRCWWSTECGGTVRVTCWRFDAARARVRPIGKVCCRIWYRRGLVGKQLGLIVTDGCPGLAAAIPTVYPRVRHQCCWVHKMRNILEKVRKSDYDEAKAGRRRTR